MAKKKAKPCNCKEKKKEANSYGPLVIVAPQWVLGNKDFTTFVESAREEGGYVDVLITGVPACIPVPGKPCPKQ